MLKLRGYQHDLIGAIYAAWLTVRSVLAVLSTGGGKTIIFSSIINDHRGASAAVVHRKEILGQISCSLAKLGVKHRVVAPPKTVALIRKKHLKLFDKSFIDPHSECGVVSVQTLTSRSAGNNMPLQCWVKQITLCVFDEGHHYVKQGIWGRAVDLMTNAKLLFVTATPERADGVGLGSHAGGYCDVMVEGPGTQWLIDEGYLSRFVYKAPETDLNMSDLPITAAGDVNTKVLRARTIESHLVGDVVQHYKTHALNKKAICFASDVATSEEFAAEFTANGIRSTALCGATDQGIRDGTLEEFEFGDLKTLCNVDLFDEGFDVPGVDCAILARVTMSLSKYLQMVGRSLRPVYANGFDLTTREGRLAAMAAGPKPHAIIIDPVRNWERHGMPNWPRQWALDSRERGVRSGPSDTIPQKVCPSCTQPYEAFYTRCPWQFTPGCATPPEPGGRSTPEQVDGDLMELDVDGMAALFAKLNKADMNEQDYELDQLRRGIPPVGRGADMKRHKSAQYRRKILKELVGWWVGLQPPDREMNEKHRRFYHRFGIDIGTAFTLNAKDTDALFQRIQQRFSEDMV